MKSHTPLHAFATNFALTCALLPWLPGLRNKPNLTLVYVYQNKDHPDFKGWYFYKNTTDKKLYSLADALADSKRATEWKGDFSWAPLLSLFERLENAFVDPASISSPQIADLLNTFPLHFEVTQYSNSYHYDNAKKAFKSVQCSLPKALHFVQQHALLDPKKTSIYHQILEFIANNSKLTPTLKSQWEAVMLDKELPLVPAKNKKTL